MSKRHAAMLGLFGAALLGTVLLSFLLGRFPIATGELVRILWGRLFGLETAWPEAMERIVFNIRLPRVGLACMVGMCLSAAGAAYQSVFQNPMASPDVLGASNGAAFGAALGIWLGLGSRCVTGMAFAMSLVAVGAAFAVSRRAKGKQLLTLILCGMMLSSLFGAGTSYIKLVADPTNQLPAITYWLMGSLSGATLDDLAFAAIPMALGLLPLWLTRWKLNILAMGDDEARSLGVSPERLRLLATVSATLLTAASVSVSGVIGWVGLIVPHVARRLVGNDHRVLTPASMLLGAVFLLAVDDVSRSLLAVEIPIGILTSLLGAPFFLWLITRRGDAF